MYLVPFCSVPGAPICVIDPRTGIVHTAICAEDRHGMQRVVDCSPEHGVSERSVFEFTNGLPIHFIDYGPSFAPQQILSRARSQIGKPYRLFSSNCQHFTSWCATGVPKSQQIATGLAIAAVCAVAVAALAAAA